MCTSSTNHQNDQSTPSRWAIFVAWLKKVIRREGPVILAYLSMMGGAAAFCLMIDQVWGTELLDRYTLVIFVPIIHLSKVFHRLKPRRRQPWLLYIARWFREGFWAGTKFVPQLTKGSAYLRRLLKNLSKS